MLSIDLGVLFTCEFATGAGRREAGIDARMIEQLLNGVVLRSAIHGVGVQIAEHDERFACS